MEFSGNTDPANPALSNNQRRKLVEALVGKTADFIQGDLCLSLEESLHDCRIRLDPDDSEGMTLLVEYDSLYETGADSYVQPRIKIEGGARSALEPHSLQSVSPYIQSQLEGYDLSVSGITTIAAERTFLDKLLILHGWHCGYRDEGRLPKEGQRLSRHYYDVGIMASTAIAENAIHNTALFRSVRSRANALSPELDETGRNRNRWYQAGPAECTTQKSGDRLHTDEGYVIRGQTFVLNAG